jgi:hypothetical protein
MVKSKEKPQIARNAVSADANHHLIISVHEYV